MTYNKPSDVSYTDMCIYIDDVIYSDNFDENKVFEYLYHLCLMLATKAKFFTRNCYYDGFAIFAASRVYMRLTNRKQFDLDAEGNPKMKRIKSVLNYIKGTLYFLKVDYEQQEYAQSMCAEADDEPLDYSSVVRDSVQGLQLVEFEMTMRDVGKTCKLFLQCLPYRRTSAEWLNIYVSVMLTFMNSITLRNADKRRIEHLQSTARLKDSHVEEMFLNERYEKPVLFHLPASMADYVTVLARQLRMLVSKDLSSIIHTTSCDLTMAQAIVRDFTAEQETDYED